jgi:Rap1a immunity proteins
MKSWGYLVAAGFFCLGISPAVAATFGELTAWCAPAEAGGRPTLCSRYLGTYLEALASPDASLNDGVRACVPEAADRAELVHLILAYADANPASDALSGIAGAGKALEDRYPCR